MKHKTLTTIRELVFQDKFYYSNDKNKSVYTVVGQLLDNKKIKGYWKKGRLVKNQKGLVHFALQDTRVVFLDTSINVIKTQQTDLFINQLGTS